MRALAWMIGKDGELSKTAVMLWLAYLAVIFKYVFANQTVGTPWGDYPVGHFDEVEAITILSLVSGLYLSSNRIWQPGQTANITKKPLEDSTDSAAPSAHTSPSAAAQTQPSQPLPVDPALFLELLKLLPKPVAPGADAVEKPNPVPATAPALPAVPSPNPDAEDNATTEPLFKPKSSSPND